MKRESRRDPRNGICKAIFHHFDQSHETGPKETGLQQVLSCKDTIVAIDPYIYGSIWLHRGKISAKVLNCCHEG